MSYSHGDAELAQAHEILRVLVGSTVHGVGVNDQDDRDEMGICVEPRSHVIGLQQFQQWVYRTRDEGERSGPGDVDLVVYGLRTWMRLASAGNPSMLLPLFVQPQDVIVSTALGERLREHAGLFVSKQAGFRFLGYLRAQRDKLLGVRGNRTNRPELVERFGFDTKFAYHMVRLGTQGVELLTEGTIHLPMKEPLRTWLTELRVGGHSRDEALELVADREAELVRLTSPSVASIPEQADVQRLNALLIELHERAWAAEAAGV